MNKTWILAESRDHCYGICNSCLELCVLNPNQKVMMKMINLIITFFKWLDELWNKPIHQAQREYRKSHILNKYEPKTWKDEYLW